MMTQNRWHGVASRIVSCDDSTTMLQNHPKHMLQAKGSKLSDEYIAARDALMNAIARATDRESQGNRCST